MDVSVAAILAVHAQLSVLILSATFSVPQDRLDKAIYSNTTLWLFKFIGSLPELL